MPRFDGTGPLSLGPGTGWGLGPCGVGMAWRRGRRFWGCLYYPYLPQLTKKEEKELLKEEAGSLEEELKEIKARLAEFKDQK